MTCRELCDVLCDYVGGELAEEVCISISRHLEICPECLHFVESYRLTIQITRRLPASPCPEHVIERVKKMLDEQK